MAALATRTIEEWRKPQILQDDRRTTQVAPEVTSPVVEFPKFDSLAAIRPQTIRMAGRLNAANVSEAEHRVLLNERQRLLDRKFSGEMTRKESNRLEYVRWSLDRIEDAKNGDALDRLEASVARYESFLAQVELLASNIRNPTRRPR